jgi:hypothetical protein
MDEAFNNWLKTPKADGGAGLAPGTPLDKTTYNMLMREYVKADSNFQPSIVTVTNPTTQAAEQAFMSSPNSAQLMRDTQPRVQYKPDKEGNLLAIEGTLANYVTNNTGERIKIDPKSNALADALARWRVRRGRRRNGVGGIPQWTLWRRGAGDECADSDPDGDARGDSDGDSYAGDGGDECSGAGGGAGVVDAGGGEGCLPGGTNQ